MPAYNAAKTIGATFQSIPQDLDTKVIVVDDASQDETVSIAKALGLEVIERNQNGGYGANQKTCYLHALKTDAEIIVMIHPDYQYDSRMIPALILPIQCGICDIMLGNRIRSRRDALEGGMPLYKYVANRILTILENFLLGQNLGEFHSGMRAYRREVLEKIPWQNNSDEFVFDQQFLIQSTYFKFRMGDVPVPARYFPEASSIQFWRSCRYGLETLWTLFLFILVKWCLIRTKIFRHDHK
ncbi:MAG: glycosyltransferase family 2 protein [Elusimicrobia bacterium]|nr:glycosyltransferase family 2 protein [Elusimicrobiota bacterium]MBI3012916.1 glycosyltransferase family 2 protein [Elusimicrobiota bacterium]MBI4218248.1 glycosyltransferase family 2 protein [Elusimicrobiota bacterium]